MKIKLTPAVVGLFVLGAMALGVVALLAFGGTSFFSKPQRFAVYFDESVHGLDLGSAVKLRGVRVGRVTGINVRYDATTRKSRVAVICELSRNVITDREGHVIDVTDRDELQTLIDQGLRAQLGIVGLATGLLYVELDFMDPRQYPADVRITDIKYAVVPAMPSAISEFQQNLQEIVTDLKRVDFVGLAGELRTLLATASGKVAALDTRAMSEKVMQAADAVRLLADSPDAKAVVANLNSAVTELRTVLARVDAQVGAGGGELTKTLQDAQTMVQSCNAAALAVRRFVGESGGLGSEAARTLRQLGEAADSVQRLADFLERNPNALITGKKRPE